MTSDEAVKLVQRVVAEAAMLADGTTAGVGELEEAREALIAALTAPAALKGQCTVAQFDHECAPGTCAMRNASGGEHDCERTAPAAGEDVELVHALEEAVKSDLLGGTTARPALTQTARDALLSRLRAVPQGWKLVPIEPTPEMLEAYVDACFRRGQAGVEGIKVGWPAACAAAPAPEKEQPK